MNGTLTKVSARSDTARWRYGQKKNRNFNGVKLCVKSFLAPLGRYLQKLITLREKECTVAHRWLFHWPTVKGTKTGNAGNSYSLHRFSINLQINVTWPGPADHHRGEKKAEKANYYTNYPNPGPGLRQQAFWWRAQLSSGTASHCRLKHHIRLDSKTIENQHAKTHHPHLFSSSNPASREETEALTAI